MSRALPRDLLAVVGAMILLMALAPPASAAAGDLDPTFRVDGKVTTDFTQRADVSYSVAIQSDGKIVAAGESGCCSNAKFALTRYSADGSLDTTFGGDGKVTTDFTADEDVAYSVAIQSDGKIVAAGTSGFTTFTLARYNTDGSLDTSFSGDGKLTTDLTSKDDFANIVAIQADGKIVAVGDSGVGGSNERFALARYDTDGSLDTTFGGDGKVTTDFSPYPDVAFAMARQADGKIVVAGGARLGRSNATWALARYNTDGSLDTTFGGQGKLTTDFTRGDDDAYSLALQVNGKIVAAGQSGGSNPKFALARYNTDGSLDTTWGGGDGKLTTDFTHGYDSAYSVTIQADGKIVAVGTPGFEAFALVRYLAA